MSSGRRSGETHPNAKLTQEQADKIRASKMGPSELSRLYGVSKATVSLIKRGKLWAPPTNGSPGPDGGVVTAPPAQIPATEVPTTATHTTMGVVGPSVAVVTPTKVVYDLVEDDFTGDMN